ncbi:VOC family protein [Egicoccus sp. AB-alg6-2]|uniref:VOC family protein n=1 Tax=Egicoccus sp. AB-alg6-2 TaxID=3242692 RepID=UPI00359CE496
MPPRPRLHHVSVSVTDLEASANWYRRVLAVEEIGTRQGAGWRKSVLGTDGFLVSLTRHDAADADDRFDETRVGLDHLAIGCDRREDLDAWLAHVDELGLERSPVTEAPHAHLFTCRDPDGMPVEFYWPVG